MEGFATFYLQGYPVGGVLPLRGCIKVTPDYYVSIRSMYVGLDFQLSELPQTDTTLKIRSSMSGNNLDISLRRIRDLDCFYGEGISEKDGSVVVKFCFYDCASALSHLPHMVTWDNDWIARQTEPDIG